MRMKRVIEMRNIHPYITSIFILVSCYNFQSLSIRVSTPVFLIALSPPSSNKGIRWNCNTECGCLIDLHRHSSDSYEPSHKRYCMPRQIWGSLQRRKPPAHPEAGPQGRSATLFHLAVTVSFERFTRLRRAFKEVKRYQVN